MVAPEESEPGSREVTRILGEVAAGDPDADRRLLELVYDELKRIARAKMAGQHPGHTLQPTALVNEAYLKLLGGSPKAASFHDSSHFFTAAAAAMRSVLVDHARRKGAEKRGGGAARITLHPDLQGESDPLERVLQVHDVLDGLAEAHPRPARVVELLFFGGLTAEEAASVLSVSDRTIKRDWSFGRAWLLRAMADG